MSADLKRVLLARNANRFESINVLDPRAKNLQRLKESIAAFSQLYGQDHGSTISDEKLAKIINELKDPRSSVDQVLVNVLDISDPNISTSLLLPDIISDLEKLTPTKRRSFEFSGSRSFEDKLPTEITELNADGKLITAPLSDFPEDAGAVGSARRALTYSHFPKNQITEDGYEKVSELSLDDPGFKIKYPVQYKRISKLINKTDPALSSEEYGIGIWKVASLNWDIEYFYADKNNKEFRIKDEFGNYPNHIFVLKHKSTGEKVFLGDDDIRTLFSDPWFSAERIIIDRLRSNERPSYKKRLEELRPLLYLTLDKYTSTDPNKNELIEKTEQILKKPQFTDKDLDFIDDAYFICEEVWTEKGFPHSATKFLEAYREINHIVSNETVLKLADENHTTGLVKEKLLDVPARTITNETVNSIIDLYESLINIQKTLEVEFGLLGTPTPKEHNPRFDLGTVAGQADVKIADRIYTDLEASNKVLNVALDGPRQLITIADAIYETAGIDDAERKKLLSNLHDLDPITYKTYTHPNPERVLGNIKTLNANGLPENESEKLKPNSYKTISANCLFNRLNDDRNAITNTFIAFENLLVKPGEAPGEVIVSNPKQYQMSKTNLRDLFRVAGYEEVSPPELTSNELSDDLSTRINGNGSARNLIKKTYEYAVFRKVTPFTADEIRRKFDLLDESFFKTKSEKCKEESPTSPREDAEFILRPDYLMGLSVISNASISNQLIPGSSSIVTRRDIIHDSQYAEFEERLATLQHYSSEEYGTQSHLTKREKTKLDEIIQLWDVDFSNALTRDQVAFIMTTSNKAVETEELPAKIKSNAKSNYGKKCTLWDAYKTERDSRLRFSEPSILSIRRPGETLAARIKYAFDKRLDKYNFPCTIILENPKEISNAVFRASIPTGIAMEYGFVSDFISEGGRFMPSPPLNVSKKAASIYKSSLSQINVDRFTGRLGFIAPSDLVNPDTLISYFKESTTFNERLFSLISNKNLNPDFLHHCFSNICEKIRIHELCTNTGIPYKEEVEALAKFFQISPEILDPLYELREATPPATPAPPTTPIDSTPPETPTPPDPIPTPDPIPPSQPQINTDPLTLIYPLSDTKITVSPNEEGTFIRKEISDFVEESLATLEYANKKGNLKEQHVAGFNEIKKLWDEEFILTLDRNQIAFLRDVLNSKPKKRGLSLLDLAKKAAESNKDFLLKQRNSLSGRLTNAIEQKLKEVILELRAGIAARTVSVGEMGEAVGRKFNGPAPCTPVTDPETTYFYNQLESNGYVIAPRKFLQLDHIVQLFTESTSVIERVKSLFSNNNYSKEGLEHYFVEFLKQEGVVEETAKKMYVSLDFSFAGDHPLQPEIKDELTFFLAKFFGVEPSDIDPKLIGKHLDFPTFAPEPPTPPTPPTEPTDSTPPPPDEPGPASPVHPITPTVSPSDTTSISLTCPLSNIQITATPNPDGNYDRRGIVDFVEEALAAIEFAKQGNHITEPSLSHLNEIKRLWDEEFVMSLSEEQLVLLEMTSDQQVQANVGGLGINTLLLGDYARSEENFRLQHGQKSILEEFRPTLKKRLEDLIEKRYNSIDSEIGMVHKAGKPYSEETVEKVSKILSTICSKVGIDVDPPFDERIVSHLGKKLYTIFLNPLNLHFKVTEPTPRLLNICFGPQKFIPPATIADSFTNETIAERLQALSTNENLSPKGIAMSWLEILNGKIEDNPTVIKQVEVIVENILNGSRIPNESYCKILATIFGVNLTDLIPPSTAIKTTTPPANEDYKLIGAVSQAEVQCLLNDRDNYRPLDYMSLEDRIKLYEKLPETVNRRDLNETVLVELYLTAREQLNHAIAQSGLPVPDASEAYSLVFSSWDRDFSLTLPKELKERLILRLNASIENITKSETESIEQTNKSSIFSRPKLAQKVSTELERRFNAIDFEQYEKGSFTPLGFHKIFVNIKDNVSPRPGFFNISHKDKGVIDRPSLMLNPNDLSRSFTLLDSIEQRLMSHFINANIRIGSLKSALETANPQIHLFNPNLERDVQDLESLKMNDSDIIDMVKMQETLKLLGSALGFSLMEINPICDLFSPTTPSSSLLSSTPTLTIPTPSLTASSPSKPAQPKPTAKPPKAKPKGIVEILIEKAFKASSEDDPLLATVRKITKNGIDSARKTPISLEELNEIINKIKSGDLKTVSKYLAQIAGKGFGERRAESNAKEIIAAIKTRVSEA